MGWKRIRHSYTFCTVPYAVVCIMPPMTYTLAQHCCTRLGIKVQYPGAANRYSTLNGEEFGPHSTVLYVLFQFTRETPNTLPGIQYDLCRHITSSQCNISGIETTTFITAYVVWDRYRGSLWLLDTPLSLSSN